MPSCLTKVAFTGVEAHIILIGLLKTVIFYFWHLPAKEACAVPAAGRIHLRPSSFRFRGLWLCEWLDVTPGAAGNGTGLSRNSTSGRSFMLSLVAFQISSVWTSLNSRTSVNSMETREVSICKRRGGWHFVIKVMLSSQLPQVFLQTSRLPMAVRLDMSPQVFLQTSRLPMAVKVNLSPQDFLQTSCLLMTVRLDISPRISKNDDLYVLPMHWKHLSCSCLCNIFIKRKFPNHNNVFIWRWRSPR